MRLRRGDDLLGANSLRESWVQMQRMVLGTAAAILVAVGSCFGAGASVGISAAGAAELASKSAFCGANDSIDRASRNADTNAQFLAVLKAHTHALETMKKDAPPGAVGQLAKQLVSDAQQAVSSNNANDLNNLPDGANVDTYCRVDGVGSPLPSYFGKGKSTAFCSNFVPIFQAVSNAPNTAGVLAALSAHKAQISQLASELQTLPKSIRAKATTTVDRAQAAVQSNNAATIRQNGGGSAMDVALYCGQNE